MQCSKVAVISQYIEIEKSKFILNLKLNPINQSKIMIKAILVFNNHGKPRLSKFYQYFNESGEKNMKICYGLSKNHQNLCHVKFFVFKRSMTGAL
jgi:hypothetical protein